MSDRTKTIERLSQRFVLAEAEVPMGDYVLDCESSADDHRHNHKCFRREFSTRPELVLFFPAKTPQQHNTLTLWLDMGAVFTEITVEQARAFINRHYGVTRLSEADRKLMEYKPTGPDPGNEDELDTDVATIEAIAKAAERRRFLRERRDHFLAKLRMNYE